MTTYSKVVLVGAVLAVLLFAGVRLFRPGPGGRRRAKEETEEKEQVAA